MQRQCTTFADKANVELCGEPHKLEIDTGATRTVLNKETYNKLRDKLELKSSKAALMTTTTTTLCYPFRNYSKLKDDMTSLGVSSFLK